MKIIKTRLRNKIEDEFLEDNFVYIERKIAKSFNSDLIFDDFVSLRPRRMQFKALCILYFPLLLY
jgi:hypothetical protein